MTTGVVGPNGQWVSSTDVPNQGVAVPAADYTVLTATGAVVARPAICVGYEVTTALNAFPITVYDNASAASGNVLFVIPASQPEGVYIFPVGQKATAGIYASFGGTGTVNFLYQ